MTQQPDVPYRTSAYPTYSGIEQQSLSSIADLLKQAIATIANLRRTFRGEAKVYTSDGGYSYQQILKPIFVRTDPITQKPKKEWIEYLDPNNNIVRKEIFVPHDEAIEEVLSMLYFMGINQITQLTNIDENTILDDLREFECKLAALLMLKQKAWGIDKELLPMTMTKIKTIVQDARYQACEGATLKAIQKSVQRIEQVTETQTKKGMLNNNFYN